MQGTIKDRIKKKGIDSQGKIRTNLKVYDVSYRYKDAATGKNKQTVKRGFMTKLAAQNFLVELNNKLMTNTFLMPKIILFQDYLRDWLQTYGKVNLRDSTYIGYSRIIEFHLIPHLGGLDLKDISAADIDKLYAYLLQNGRVDGKGGLSSKSVQYTHRVLNEALEHAVKKQLIYHNPIKGITNIPKPKRFQSNIYTAEEILQLLKVVKDTMYEVPIALAAICGLRRGECLAITKNDIDFKNQTIRINKQLIDINNKTVIGSPKSEDSNRTISAPPEVFHIIIRHMETNEKHQKMLLHEYDDQGWIVCQDNGKFIRPVLFSKNFANMIDRNHLKKIRFHDLRHSCASLMLKSGVAMKTASQILGHSSISITADLYTHVLEETKKEAAAQIGNMLFGEASESKEPHLK